MVSSSPNLDGALDPSTGRRPPTNCGDEDVLANSIIALESLQEALEKEVKKFEEIGREYASPRSPTFSELHIVQNSIQARAPLESEVHTLKTKLEELSGMMKAKEDEMAELESILNKRPSTSESLECLLMQKMEFEIEFLVISKTIRRLNQISLFEEQKCLAVEQIEMLHKLKDAEHKAVALKNKAEELEASREQMLAMEEVLKTQNKLYVYTLCLAAQIFLLLLFVFVIFMLRPRTYGVVPT